MTSFFRSICLTFFAVVSLSACQTTSSNLESTPSSAELPPLEASRAVAGDRWTAVDGKGAQNSGTVLTVDAQYISRESSDGCKWKLKINSFAPDVAWTDCNGSSGTQTSKRTGDSIFPLQVGKTESWEVSGTDTNGASWKSTRNCKVIGIANVTVPAGNFDTYHVRCEDRFRVREWFLRSDGVTVQFSSIRKTGAADRNFSWKLVSFTPAA